MGTPVTSPLCDARDVAAEQRIQAKIMTTNQMIAMALAVLTMMGMIWKSGAEVATAQSRITTMEQWEQKHLEETSANLSRLDDRLARIDAQQSEQAKSMGRVEGALRVIIRNVK